MKNYKSVLAGIYKALIAIFLISPILVLVIYSFADRWITILPEGFTLEYYIEIFHEPKFWIGIVRGLIISIIPVVITNIAVLLALYFVIVYAPKFEKVIQLLCMIPLTINGIIIATSVLSTYAGTDFFLSNRIIMLASIYCVFVLPMTYQGIRNSLYAVNVNNLLEAAEMLGRDRLYTYFNVVIPSILPGLCSTALISITGLFGDFAIIKIIASSQYETVQAYLYRTRNTDVQSLSVDVVIILIITLGINFAVHYTQNKKAERRKN